MAEKTRTKSPAFHEVVFRGSPKAVRGLLAGVILGADEAADRCLCSAGACPAGFSCDGDTRQCLCDSGCLRWDSRRNSPAARRRAPCGVRECRTRSSA